MRVAITLITCRAGRPASRIAAKLGVGMIVISLTDCWHDRRVRTPCPESVSGPRSCHWATSFNAPFYSSSTNEASDCGIGLRLIAWSFCLFDCLPVIKFFMSIRCDDIGPLVKDYVSCLGMPDRHAAVHGPLVR